MADPRPGELTPKLSEMVVAEIKRQGLTGKSSRHIAREFGVHYQTVANYRRRLEKAGVIERLPRGGTAIRLDNPAAGAEAMNNPGPAGTFNIADFWQKMPDIAVLTGEQILRRLSYLAVSPEVPPTIHIAASKALFELKEAEAAKEANQLAIPETAEEAFVELKLMRQIVGREAWRRADDAVVEEEEKWKAQSVSAPAPVTGSAPAAGSASVVAEPPGEPSSTTGIPSPLSGLDRMEVAPEEASSTSSPSAITASDDGGAGGAGGADPLLE